MKTNNQKQLHGAALAESHFCIYYYNANLNPNPTANWARCDSAKQRCVMGVGMCLYAQLVQTKISSAKVQLYYNVIIRIYLTSVPDPS